VKFHEHKAAVKAIGWCPSNPSTLASGGGTADRHIRFFSTQTLAQNYCIDTGTPSSIQALKSATSSSPRSPTR
jgi:WD40 repeat protein